MKHTNVRLLCLAFAIILVFAAGVWLRGKNLSARGLEYDEIWTLEKYSSMADIGEMLTSLSTPNNHPLNSLLIKISTNVLGENETAVRLPAFLSGVLAVAAVALLTALLTRSPAATLLSVIFSSFSGILIRYSQTGRGYSLQTLLLLLFATSFLCHEACGKNSFWRRQGAYIALSMIFAVLSILTLPTSILYVTPICGLHLAYLLINQYKTGCHRIVDIATSLIKDSRTALIAYGTIAVFSLAWYIAMSGQLSTGKQGFGVPMKSAVDFLAFLRETISQTSGWPLLILGCCAILSRKYRLAGVGLLALILFPMAASILTSAGPSRVYTPAAAFACVAAALGCHALWQIFRGCVPRPSAVAAGILSLTALTAYFYSSSLSWLALNTPPDWKRIIPELTKDLPLSVYVNYPPCDQYPISRINGKAIIMDNLNRTPRVNGWFAQLFDGSAIQGMDNLGGMSSLGISSRLKPRRTNIQGLGDLYAFRLKNITNGNFEKHSVVLAFIGPAPEDDTRAITSLLFSRGPGKWLSGNIYLRLNAQNDKGERIQTLSLMSDNCPFSTEELIKIQNGTNGYVRFFYLASADDAELLTPPHGNDRVNAETPQKN